MDDEISPEPPPEGEDAPPPLSTATVPGGVPSSAFHAQLEYVSQQQIQPPSTVNSHGYQPYDMGTMAAALPQTPFQNAGQRFQYIPGDAPVMLSPASVYQIQQVTQYGMRRASQYESTPAPMASQQYMTPLYAPMLRQPALGSKQPLQIQPYGQYGVLDPYAYGMGQMHIPQMDPRFAPRGPYGAMPQFHGDASQYTRRASEPAAIPAFPRGPPRKPKQSGHALWVGNLPPGATVIDLKDHFSRDAREDIESLFLISKSNCAFVNYRSEAACDAAMHRFHDSRFHGVRLVCRLRRTMPSVSGAPSMIVTDALGTPPVPEGLATSSAPALLEEPTSPTIVSSSPTTENQPAITIPNQSALRANEKYFIVKSLTVQDLQASVRNGIWTTQSHNESILNRAYEEADNVYLIFSANKSGEYFGYARMASSISGDPVNLDPTSRADEPQSPGAPHSIPTPATATAPKGRVIDDSARGTIFWEAELSDDDEDGSPTKEVDESSGAGEQARGRQFTIEWISTARLPFYRTRGLRNPWNAGREVKIARDGTELEPTVGRRLLQMFHGPLPGPSQPYQ